MSDPHNFKTAHEIAVAGNEAASAKPASPFFADVLSKLGVMSKEQERHIRSTGCCPVCLPHEGQAEKMNFLGHFGSISSYQCCRCARVWCLGAPTRLDVFAEGVLRNANPAGCPACESGLVTGGVWPEAGEHKGCVHARVHCLEEALKLLREEEHIIETDHESMHISEFCTNVLDGRWVPKSPNSVQPLEL